MKHTPLPPLDGSEQPHPKANAGNNHVATVGELLDKLIKYNIYLYHPPGANPTNGDLNRYEVSIAQLQEQLTDMLGSSRNATTDTANAPTPVTLKKRNEAE